MEKYEHLEMEVICFDNEDIITTSGPSTANGNTNTNIFNDPDF